MAYFVSYSRCKLCKLFRFRNVIIATLFFTFLVYFQSSQTPLSNRPESTALVRSEPLSEPPLSHSKPPSRPYLPPFRKVGNLSDVVRSLVTGDCLTTRPAKSTKVMAEWERVGRGDAWIFIYSAFYDDRPNAGILPIIRIVSMSTIFRDKIHETVYCYVWYDGIKHPVVAMAIVNETGANLYYHNNLPHGEFTITCPLQICVYVPSHVSLSLDYCPSSFSSFTVVQSTVRAPPEIEFGICVVNGYGSLNEADLIEWFESYLAFGVAEFNLYNTSYSRKLRPLFSYYQRMPSKTRGRGVLTVDLLPHPTAGYGSGAEIVRNLRTVAMNDCLMRNMYRYKYILTVDHDEIVTPRNSSDYQEMMKQIFNEKIPPRQPDFSFTFQNLFFLKDFAEDGGTNKKPSRTDTNWKLLTERYTYRCEPKTDFFYFATKSFVNPLYCFNLFNHFCSVAFPPYTRVVSYHVPVRIAANHHYRQCGQFYLTNCSALLEQKTFDGTSLRFGPRLRRDVVNVYNKIF